MSWTFNFPSNLWLSKWCSFQRLFLSIEQKDVDSVLRLCVARFQTRLCCFPVTSDCWTENHQVSAATISPVKVKQPKTVLKLKQMIISGEESLLNLVEVERVILGNQDVR